MATTSYDERFMLTTRDNPYSPFTDYRRWLVEDNRLGYNTSGMLARFANYADVIEDEAAFYAMRSIIDLNLSGQHVMVVREDYAPFLSAEVRELV